MAVTAPVPPFAGTEGTFADAYHWKVSVPTAGEPVAH